MQSGNIKKAILIICAIIAISIWSYNLTLFFPGSKIPRAPSTSDDAAVENSKEIRKAESSLASAPFVYQEKYKDPFLPFFLEKEPARKEKEVKRSKPRPVQVIPPTLNLVGILWDSKNPQAIVADSSGETHVLRRGDTLHEMKITRIRHGEVCYTFKSKTFKLLLPEK